MNNYRYALKYNKDGVQGYYGSMLKDRSPKIVKNPRMWFNTREELIAYYGDYVNNGTIHKRKSQSNPPKRKPTKQSYCRGIARELNVSTMFVLRFFGDVDLDKLVEVLHSDKPLRQKKRWLYDTELGMDEDSKDVFWTKYNMIGYE